MIDGISKININKIARTRPSEIDLVITWPKNCDYPLWRKQIHENRFRFRKVIIVFMETNEGTDYRKFVVESMDSKSDYITFFDSPVLTGTQDWRDVAVNYALDYSQADIVWFTEQDFFITKKDFWEEIYGKLMMGFDIVGITQGGRLHPACIFADRTIIDKTKRKFGVIPNVGDHFAQFQKDIEEMNVNRCYIENEELYGYKHMNGLSHNWRLVSNDEPANYEPDKFYNYLKDCLLIENEFKLHPTFKEICQTALNKYINK